MTEPIGPVLTIRSLSKTFAGQTALNQVDLTLHAGEVHCLLGQNGSGKSTLIKILAGYHAPDPGSTATLNGAPLTLGSTAAARDSEIRFIHQDLGLVDELDVVDNLALGGRYAGRWWLSDRRERRAAHRLLLEYGVDIDPSAPLAAAGAGQHSMVAIVRAMARSEASPSLLVLDEPTASLPQHQTRQLFDLVRALKARGTAVLYVTHRLGEVFEIGDRVTVLRDGKDVATRTVGTLDTDQLVHLIIGRELTEFSPQAAPPRSDVVLDIAGMSGAEVRDFSAQVHAGEIVGLTGLVGSGYDQVLALAFGGRTARSGTVAVEGASVRPGRPDASIRAGLAYAPADRKRLSTIPDWSVKENVTLPRVPSARFGRWLGGRRERRETLPWTRRVGVVPDDPDRQLALLSGGNQQKAVLSRWLRLGARALLLDEPTAGIDTGAKASIYEALSSLAALGTSVVLSSSDADELCAVCDRVIIMRRGAIAAVLSGQDLTVARITSETIRDGHPAAHGGPS
ncbi:sugar ABC transporter ATP-binding protein [Streptomyces sp. NPDC059455]|uniref:sugar ABC transporter ATP-binding protein n=1 Tax=Streptomyces sp. NPDC059455 TaxID=3346837 RepID=UPI0036BEC0CF